MPTPDYHRIGQLERELGIGQPEPTPERSTYPSPPVCLIKDCAGDDYEIRSWSGPPIRRIHEH